MGFVIDADNLTPVTLHYFSISFADMKVGWTVRVYTFNCQF